MVVVTADLTQGSGACLLAIRSRHLVEMRRPLVAMAGTRALVGGSSVDLFAGTGMAPGGLVAGRRMVAALSGGPRRASQGPGSLSRSIASARVRSQRTKRAGSVSSRTPTAEALMAALSSSRGGFGSSNGADLAGGGFDASSNSIRSRRQDRSTLIGGAVCLFVCVCLCVCLCVCMYVCVCVGLCEVVRLYDSALGGKSYPIQRGGLVSALVR